jgi:hypothetical protein
MLGDNRSQAFKNLPNSLVEFCLARVTAEDFLEHGNKSLVKNRHRSASIAMW